MIKVAICGGSGYAGAELLRILAFHPEIEITVVTSEKSAGKSVSDLFPHLRNYSHLFYEPLKQDEIISKADIFFMALPHGASQEAVHLLASKDKIVIDLSADYRLKDAEVYERWYKIPHRFKNILKKAVYGLPEIHRKRIARSKLVANPGCYPTGAILGLYPALKNGIIDTSSIVIDSKSGTSGAGRQSDIPFSFCEVNEGFKAYGVTTHRHTPEIEQELSAIAGEEIKVDFIPHLLPIDRGIITTIYAKTLKGVEAGSVYEIYRNSYKKEPFVRLLEPGKFPNVKHIRGTNFCDIGLTINARTGTLIIVTAIDNLVKGASGQAVQNMNIMMGFPETLALNTIALFP